MFEVAQFVSTNVVLTDPSGLLPVVARIGFGLTPGVGFSFTIVPSADRLRVKYWHRPEGLPLVGSAPSDPVPPLPPGQEGVERRLPLPDAARGHVPYVAAGPILVSFPTLGLPALGSQDPQPFVDRSATWVIATATVGDYFLPTVPGITMQPGVDGQSVRWVYRHGPPVLDERYAVARETPGASPSGDGSDVPDPLAYTSVFGGVSFELKTSAAVPASGWLARTEDNPGGVVQVNAGNWQDGLILDPLAPGSISASWTEG